jgi:hypothetical protein
MNIKSGSRARAGAIHRWLTAVSLATAAIVLTGTQSRAQCIEFSERASQVDLETFTKSPSSLLQKLRNDKEKLKYRLAAYIATDPSVLPSVQTLIGEAMSADKSAIGSALRIAEARCTTTKRDAARKIGDFVKRIGDLTVLAGYSAAGEDQSAPQLQTRAGQQASRRGDLMSGEWKTKLADPFKPIPLPR